MRKNDALRKKKTNANGFSAIFHRRRGQIRAVKREEDFRFMLLNKMQAHHQQARHL